MKDRIRIGNLSFYDDLAAIERYLNLPKGSLDKIPIYARKPAVDAILKVRELEKETFFRPGLYYIVLADLCANTAFNAKYGDAEADIRTQWFHTAAIQTIGEIQPRNYIAFSKQVGDGALFIFSSFFDVFEWSERFTSNLQEMTSEYPDTLSERGIECEDTEFDQRLKDFELRARRLVHLCEVAYKEECEPLCLAVSQTFKIEKSFSETDLGCTQAVANAIKPKLAELGVELYENKRVAVPGLEETMTFYIRKVLKT